MAPSSPAATNFKLYFDSSDHLLKWKNSAGTVTTIATGASSFTDPMTTRGDIIIRNSSNATARLGIGSSGKVVSSDGTDISWQTPSSGGEFATQTAAVATGESTSSTTAADLATTGPSVTVTVGASGQVEVMVRCRQSTEVNGKYSIVWVTWSGANSGSLDMLIETQYGTGGVGTQHGASKILTGLSPGSTTFKLQYSMESGGSSAGFTIREITVKPVL